MKQLVYLGLLTCCSILSLSAQVLKGEYRNGTEVIKFDNNRVSYTFKQSCCIVYEYKGIGKWCVEEDRLIIEPGFSDTTNTITKPSVSKDTLFIDVSTNDTSQIIVLSVIFFRQKKVLWGFAPNYGRISVSRKSISSVDSVTISMLGYQSANFKLEPAKDYQVIMAKGFEPSVISAFLRFKDGGMPYKIRNNKLLIKRFVEINHQVRNMWFAYTRE